MAEDSEDKLKQAFLDEAVQLIADAEIFFLRLEQRPDDPETIEALFRLAHNLKGSALAVGLRRMGEFTHELESVLLQIKCNGLTVDGVLVDLLLRSCDYVSRCVTQLKSSREELPRSPIILELQLCMSAAGELLPYPAGLINALSESEALTEAAGVPTKTLSQFVPGGAGGPPIVKSRAAAAKPQPPSEENIRVSLARLERLLNLVGESVILQSVLKQQAQEMPSTIIRTSVHQLGKVIKEIQDLSMSLRMMPIQQTFSKLQRIVRDTSQKLDKSVRLHISGEETEVDKTVLEKLGDPLVHLIRNAVDHGIETAARRVSAGKPTQGRIDIKAFHQGGALVVEIQDDGAGIDPEDMRLHAVKQGMIAADAVLTPNECLQLIYRPGFSTKASVTDVSGRGVGMDVVKTNIEQLQGEIQVETKKGRGTTFRVRLPLTLAITESIIVKCSGERYVIPLAHVLESVKANDADIRRAPGNGELFMLRGDNLPLFRSNVLLGLKATASEGRDRIVLILKGAAGPLALLVDDILGQQQVVIKQLGSEHEELRVFSGSAILGDGRPALILEVSELLAKRRLEVEAEQKKLVA